MPNPYDDILAGLPGRPTPRTPTMPSMPRVSNPYADILAGIGTTPQPEPTSFMDRIKSGLGSAYRAVEEAPAVAAQYYGVPGAEVLSQGLTPQVPSIAQAVEEQGLTPDQRQSYAGEIGRKILGTAAELGASPTNAALLAATGGLGEVAARGLTARAALESGMLVPEAAAAATRAASVGRAAGLAGRATSLGFAAQMAPAAYEQAKQAYEQGLTPQGVASGIGAGLTAGMAGLAGLHGLKPSGPTLPIEEAIRQREEARRGLDLADQADAAQLQVGQNYLDAQMLDRLQAQRADEAQLRLAQDEANQALLDRVQRDMADRANLALRVQEARMRGLQAPPPDLGELVQPEPASTPLGQAPPVDVRPRVSPSLPENAAVASLEPPGGVKPPETPPTPNAAPAVPPVEPAGIVPEKPVERRTPEREQIERILSGLSPEQADIVRAHLRDLEGKAKEAVIDPTSGLLNKRGWEALQTSVDPRADHAMVLDLKGFKPINDKIGHAQGDQVLRSVGEVLRKHFGDESSRFGGDEFGAVMRGLPGEEMQAKVLAFSDDLHGLKIQLRNPATGETVDVPPLDAHIGVGRNAEQADIAANRARDAFGSGRPAEAEPGNPRLGGSEQGTAGVSGEGLEGRGPELTPDSPEVQYQVDAAIPAAIKALSLKHDTKSVAIPGERGEISGRLAPGGHPAKADFGLEDLPEGPKEIVKALKRDKGNALEMRVRSAMAEKFARDMEDYYSEEPPEGGKYATRPRPRTQEDNDRLNREIHDEREREIAASRRAANVHPDSIRAQRWELAGLLNEHKNITGALAENAHGYERFTPEQVDRMVGRKAELERAANYTRENIRHLESLSVPDDVNPREYLDNPANAKFAVKPAPGQRGLPGIGEDVEAQREKKGKPVQTSMFGGEMLQPTEARVTEGREKSGPLFTQEQERQAKADREAQGGIKFAEERPVEPSREPADEAGLYTQEAPDEIADFGEKIGGARKDVARPLGPRSKTTEVEDDTRPTWQRRYRVFQDENQRTKLGDKAPWSIARNDQLLYRDFRPMEFASKAEAENIIPLYEVSRNHYVSKQPDGTWAIIRKVAERKRAVVRGGFESEMDAKKFMASSPAEVIEHKFDVPEKPWLDRIEREGPSYRQGDVKPKQFQDTFGFRGGEFGNWNMGSDGQAALNHAYDGLMDLSRELGVPPKALSLNGQLAIAFGARGHGGKDSVRAHYEPDRAVINLTKIKGAGSLAHEWFHALDHYFSRQGGGKSEATVTKGFPYNSTSRPELKAAFDNVMREINSAERTQAISDTQAAKFADRMAESVDRVLKDIRSNFTYEPYNKRMRQATPEELAQFDAIAERIKAGDVGEKRNVETAARSRFANYRESYEAVEELNDLYKKVRGRAFATSDEHSLGKSLVAHIGSMFDARKKVEKARAGESETRRGASDYLRNARNMDSLRATDYWSLPHEMAARAFEAYAFDKFRGLNERSDYLTSGVENKYFGQAKPYPEGAERAKINEAFDKLFETIKTRETERGVEMYQAGRSEPQSKEAFFKQAQKNWSQVPGIQRIGDALAFRSPSGKPILIRRSGEIEFDPASLKKGHGEKTAKAVEQGTEQVVGRTYQTKAAIIAEAMDTGVLDHEIGHVAKDHFATARERAAIEADAELNRRAKESGRSVDEEWADFLGDYVQRRRAGEQIKPTSVLHRVASRIFDFFQRVYDTFKPSKEGFARGIESGRVFERSEKGSVPQGAEQYATAPKTPPDVSGFKAKPIPPEKEAEKVKPLGRPMVEGEAPRVESKVADFNEVKGALPKRQQTLAREAPRTWESLDPEIQYRLDELLSDGEIRFGPNKGKAKTADEKQAEFFRRAQSGQINDVDTQVLDALVTGKREAYENVRERYLKAQDEGRDTGPENVQYLKAALDKATTELALAARSDVQAGTRLARALAARARVMDAAGKSTPDQFLKRVFREIPDVSDAQAADLVRIMQEDPASLSDALIAATKPKAFDKYLEFWKAGLVSAPGTQLANIFGNIGEQVARLGETATASMLDPLIGGGGSRLKGEARYEFAGAMKGISNSLGRLGTSLRDIAKLAPEEVNLARLESGPKIEGKKGRAIRIPFRLLSAFDDFFKGVGGEAELHKLAFRRAKGNVAEAQRIIESAPKDLLEAVAKSRLERTFQEPNRMAQSIMQMRANHKWLHIVAPFVQTPSNIASVAWQRSPAGFYEGFKALRAYKEAVAKNAEAGEVARLKGEAVDKLARPLFGTMVLGTFYALAKAGGMTGSGPTDPKDRNLLKDAGWQPYSFVIPVEGNQKLYIPFNRFEPVSSIFGIAADMAEMKSDQKAGELASKAIGSIVQNFTSKTYLQGLGDAASAIADPQQFLPQYVTNLTGSVVPNIVAKGAQAIDPQIRETKPSESGFAGLGERIAKTIATRIPGASLSVPPKKSSTGENIERPSNAALRFLSPILPSTTKENADVADYLVKIDAVPSAPSREMTVKGTKVRLDTQEYELLARASKDATSKVANVTRSSQFRRMSIEDQRSYIRRLYDRYETQARKRLYAYPSFRAKVSRARSAQ